MNEPFSSIFGWLMNANAIEPEETDKLERLLNNQLAPVAPRPAYVDGLGKRLSDQSEQILVGVPGKEIGRGKRALLIAVGVVGGFLLISFGVRRIVSLSALRRTTQQATLN